MIKFEFGIRILILVIAMNCLSNGYLFSQTVSISKVQQKYFEMNKSEDGALQLHAMLTKMPVKNNPVLLAYRGASSAASAGIVKGVWNKLEYFNKGKDDIELAVRMKPLDIEIRFLRLATQLKAPGFLGYTGDIKNDKSLIITALSAVSASHSNAYLYQQICRFLLDSGKLDPSEKNTVKQLVIKFNSEYE